LTIKCKHIFSLTATSNACGFASTSPCTLTCHAGTKQCERHCQRGSSGRQVHLWKEVWEHIKLITKVHLRHGEGCHTRDV
jgi:hypothetical protein